MGCFSYVPRIDDITVPAQALYSTFISVYRIEVKKQAHFQIYIKNERICDSVSAVVVSADVWWRFHSGDNWLVRDDDVRLNTAHQMISLSDPAYLHVASHLHVGVNGPHWLIQWKQLHLLYVLIKRFLTYQTKYNYNLLLDVIRQNRSFDTFICVLPTVNENLSGLLSQQTKLFCN